MYSSFVSRRLLAPRNRAKDLLVATKTNTRIAAASFQSTQRLSLSSTPPFDDADAVDTRPGGEWEGCRRDFMAPIQIGVRGPDILHNPFFNKGTAFKSEERDRLRFRGLLPSRFNNIKMQMERFLVSLRSSKTDIEKNIQLEDLHDLNETLYHRILVDHIEEMAPLIYTPTVGQACQELSLRFRRPRGMYFTEDDRGQMASM